jgi:hypothetical protein
VRDKLLDLAMQSGSYDPHAEPVITTWSSYYTSLTFAGSGIPADETTVSGFADVLSKHRNVDYLAFAVIDTSGNCVGGVLEIDDVLNEVMSANPVSGPFAQCTGDAVADAAGYTP